jgi:hypothetical protein
VAPIITGIIVHFRFHIRCISITKLLHFNFFSASFRMTLLLLFYYMLLLLFLLLSLVTGPFSLALLLNQLRSPTLRVQVSDCNTCHTMCDILSIAVVCGESIECFPGKISKFFLKPQLLFR